MKKVCAVLFVLLLAVASFAQDHHDNVVRWKTIVGNITVSNNDAVAGINPGTTPWSTTGGRASVNLSTGHVSFEVEGLVLNGGNATGTRAGVDQVEGSLICSGHLQQPTLSDPNWPGSSGRQPALDRYGSRALLWRQRWSQLSGIKPNAVAGEVKWPRHFSLGRRPSLRTNQMRDLMRSAGHRDPRRAEEMVANEGRKACAATPARGLRSAFQGNGVSG
jgi:hypothetical protein